jgi:hypothetical protein
MNIENRSFYENRINRFIRFYFFLAGAFALGAALTDFAFRSLNTLLGENLPYVLAAIFSSEDTDQNVLS